MDDENNSTKFNILKIVGFFDNIPEIGLKSARMQDALYNLPKAIAKFRNRILPTIENVEDSNDLQEEGVKIIIPSNLIDIYTRLEVLLGLKLSGHAEALTEASNLLDQVYKMSELQNERQYQNALNKVSTP